MNSIRRAITAERKRLLTLSPLSILQQQHASSSYTTRSTLRHLKSSKTRAPEVRSQPEATPATEPPTNSYPSNDAVRKESVTWPKPSEIPWQAKVVNSVNLIGQVKIPVQFQASSDGKYWAGTIISQEDGSESSTSLPSFWIPVIFEGDLAHIAICHLKEKDYVHVAGHLSVDVPPFKLSEVQANVQVMVHSINFVEGSQSKKTFTQYELDKWSTKNSAILEKNISVRRSLKEFDSTSNQLNMSSKRTSTGVAFEQNHAQLRNFTESSPVYKVYKQGIHASWRDLLANSKQWVDNRENKRKGSVKPNYPDFKHKETGVGLWLDKAPGEVLQGLGRLQFYAMPMPGKGKNVPSGKGENDVDSWKHLVENPNKWWDNRTDKRNQKAPDFKHKDSGKGLWLGDAPAWALSDLPPLKANKTFVDEKKARFS